MLTGQDLTNALFETLRDAKQNAQDLVLLGKNLAHTERCYRIRLASEELALRDKGFPVTLIPDLARGNQEVARLKELRDVAKTEFEACERMGFVLQQDAKILNSQIARELQQ